MKHGYGYPFTAATAAAMTDTAKIYVYTGSETGYTNGNWYYWNGTAWVSGGVYNATALETDKTLTVSEAAADAQVTGFVRDQLSEYRFDNIINTRPLPSEWEIGYYLGNEGILPNANYCYTKNYINVDGFSKIVGNLGTCFYEFYDKDKNRIQNISEQPPIKEYDIPANAVYLRYSMYIYDIYENTGVYLCSLDEYNELFSQGKIGTCIRCGDIIFTGADATFSPVKDINDIIYSSIYFVQGVSGTVPDVKNLPSDFVNDGSPWILRTCASRYQRTISLVQYFERSDGGICYTRIGNTGVTPVWWDWTFYNKGITNITTMIWDNFEESIHSIDDANDAKANTIYRIQGEEGYASIANLPNNFVNDGSPYILVTYNYRFSGSNLEYIEQTFGRYGKVLFTRHKAYGSWSGWESTGSSYDDTIIECGSNKQYTTLRSAIAAAVQKNGSHVKVYPGTYDLTQEFATEIANHTAYGIELGNDVYVEFMAGSYVTAIFDDSDSWFYFNFQPFYSAGNSSFTLDGLNIKAQNTRYCVHDEHGGQGVYHHTYKNCIMHYTNTYSSPYYVQCIGGGLGQNGYISIEGGMYTSEPTYAYSGQTIDSSTQPITYHNGNNANALSKIFIKDVYLTGKGHFRFGDYGPSTNKTPVLITGCRMGMPTTHAFENQEFSVVNFEITEWNNDVAVS